MSDKTYNMTGLLTAAMRLRRLYDRMCAPIMKEYKLTRNEVDVLLFLANNPACDTAKEVAELRGLLKSQVCMAADALTRRGLLSGVQDGRDRRCVHLKLMPGAREIVEAAREAQKRFADILFEGITEEEKTVLDHVFNMIAENIKRNSENSEGETHKSGTCGSRMVSD